VKSQHSACNKIQSTIQCESIDLSSMRISRWDFHSNPRSTDSSRLPPLSRASRARGFGTRLQSSIARSLDAQAMRTRTRAQRAYVSNLQEIRAKSNKPADGRTFLSRSSYSSYSRAGGKSRLKRSVHHHLPRLTFIPRRGGKPSSSSTFGMRRGRGEASADTRLY